MSKTRSAEHSAPNPIEVSLRRKIDHSKRLDNLDTVSGNRTAGVSIRHAFRSSSAHGSVIMDGTGKYDAAVRSVDLGRVCRHLGLTLSEHEAEHISALIQKGDSICSSDLLRYFTQLMHPGKILL